MITNASWIHCVWDTKDGIQFLSEKTKYEIITHIRTNAGARGLYIDFLDGSREHLHCLLLLRPDQDLHRALKIIKGESSYWINKRKFLSERIVWADESYVSRVNEEVLQYVRDYIRKQEEQHLLKTWIEEREDLLDNCGFIKIQD